MIINQVKQKLHLVGHLPIRYFKDARYHEHKIHNRGRYVSPFHRPRRSLGRVEVYTLFLASALEGGEGSASRPGRTLPPGNTWYPLFRRLGGPQGRSGQVRKISTPPGFDPQTAQPVDSRYTDYATRPATIEVHSRNLH